jgi:hypothetical protein
MGCVARGSHLPRVFNVIGAGPLRRVAEKAIEARNCLGIVRGPRVGARGTAEGR